MEYLYAETVKTQHVAVQIISIILLYLPLQIPKINQLDFLFIYFILFIFLWRMDEKKH
jgi:hypothetical protein